MDFAKARYDAYRYICALQHDLKLSVAAVRAPPTHISQQAHCDEYGLVLLSSFLCFSVAQRLFRLGTFLLVTRTSYILTDLV